MEIPGVWEQSIMHTLEERVIGLVLGSGWGEGPTCEVINGHVATHQEQAFFRPTKPWCPAGLVAIRCEMAYKLSSAVCLQLDRSGAWEEEAFLWAGGYPHLLPTWQQYLFASQPRPGSVNSSVQPPSRPWKRAGLVWVANKKGRRPTGPLGVLLPWSHHV